MIKIPFIDGISTYNIAVINKQKYEIIQIQHIFDSLPKSVDLSLRLRGEFIGGRN